MPSGGLWRFVSSNASAAASSSRRMCSNCQRSSALADRVAVSPSISRVSMASPSLFRRTGALVTGRVPKYRRQAKGRKIAWTDEGDDRCDGAVLKREHLDAMCVPVVFSWHTAIHREGGLPVG